MPKRQRARNVSDWIDNNLASLLGPTEYNRSIAAKGIHSVILERSYLGPSDSSA